MQVGHMDSGMKVVEDIARHSGLGADRKHGHTCRYMRYEGSGIQLVCTCSLLYV